MFIKEKSILFVMAPPIIAMFVAVNLYVYFVCHMMKMMRDHHGERRSFLLSNVLIIAAIALVGLIAVL